MDPRAELHCQGELLLPLKILSRDGAAGDQVLDEDGLVFEVFVQLPTKSFQCRRAIGTVGTLNKYCSVTDIDTGIIEIRECF